MKKVIAGIEIEDTKISSASEMAEAFNCHFANIGHELARDIPPVDTVPESYFTVNARISAGDAYFQFRRRRGALISFFPNGSLT